MLYASLEQRELGLIKLVDKMINTKITGKFRQLKENSIAELMLRYTLFNKKQNNSDRTIWLKLLKNEGLSINKKYNNTWSIIKIMNQRVNMSEINEIKQSRLKYLTDITSNDQIINYNKLSTKTIKRINRQLWTKLRNAICMKGTMEVKQKYRIHADGEELVNWNYKKRR